MQRAAAVLVWMLWACGDADGGAADAGVQTPDGVSLTLRVVEALQGKFGEEPALEGVRVCAEPREVCATTDAAGLVTLRGFEPGEEVLLRHEKEGYPPVLRALVIPRLSAALTENENVLRMGMFEPDAEELEAAGVERIDPERGVVIFSPGFAGDVELGRYNATGATVTPVPESGVLFYAESPGERLVATPVEGTHYDWAQFMNVEPGEVELVFEGHDGSECIYSPGPFSGWPSREGRTNATRLPVRAGHVSYWTVVECGLPFDEDAGTPLDDDAGN